MEEKLKIEIQQPITIIQSVDKIIISTPPRYSKNTVDEIYDNINNFMTHKTDILMLPYGCKICIITESQNIHR